MVKQRERRRNVWSSRIIDDGHKHISLPRGLTSCACAVVAVYECCDEVGEEKDVGGEEQSCHQPYQIPETIDIYFHALFFLDPAIFIKEESPPETPTHKKPLRIVLLLRYLPPVTIFV